MPVFNRSVTWRNPWAEIEKSRQDKQSVRCPDPPGIDIRPPFPQNLFG